jgi:hypothetical protein
MQRTKVNSTGRLATVVLMTTVFILLFCGAAMAASLSVDKSQMQTGDSVTATYTIAFKEQEGGFVGFFKKEADDGHWITYKNFSYSHQPDGSVQTDNTFQVKVDEPGSYEFRMFKDYFGTIKLATTSVDVVFSPSSTVTAEPVTVFVGDKITATYTISGPDGNDTSGWVGLYAVGADDGTWMAYQKTGGVSGKYEVAALISPGMYEFRLFKDYFGTWKLAKSNTVTVKKQPAEDSKARFNSVTGEVGYSPDPETVEWMPCTPETVLRVGDHVSTGQDSSCILQFEDMTTFVMKPETEVIIKKPVSQQSKIGLVAGHLWQNTKKMMTNGTMEVEMGQAVAGIKGTTLVSEVTNGVSILKVLEGTVEFTSLTTGAKSMVSGGETQSATSAGLSPKQNFDAAAEAASWIAYGTDKIVAAKSSIILQLGSPTMKVNGTTKEIDPGKGTKPILLKGRTVLPIRAVVEAMGGTVEWLGAENKVTIKLKGSTIEMWIGKTTVKVNGTAKNTDVAPQVINGRTMIPVRFVAENFGAAVNWNEQTKTVTLIY